jgi:HlyD family secretion protein
MARSMHRLLAMRRLFSWREDGSSTVGLRRAGLFVLVLAVLVVLVAGYVQWRRRAMLAEGLLQANGRIEGDHVTVASKVAGRVHRLLVREGDTVTAGQVVAVLDDTQAEARVAQARAGLGEAAQRVDQAKALLTEAEAKLVQARTAVAQAEARAVQARQAVTMVEARLEAARTSLGVLRREVGVAVTHAEAGVAQGRATLARADAAEKQARRDAERMHWLVERELVEPQRSEQADLAWTAARNDVLAARSGLVQAEQRLTDAHLGPDRVRAREDEVRALEAQRGHERAGVAQAEAAAEQARAAVSQAEAVRAQARAALGQAAAAREQAQAALVEAESVRGDLTIAAPTGGVVMTRMTETGEVLAAGAPMLDVVDLDRLYVKVFVPETAIGKLRLGLPARVHIDAFPDRPFAATVRYVASRAEFTPKEVQTTEERVKLVYAVKLYLDENPDHRLTPGLPADAVIRWKEGTPWQPPRW